MRRVALLSALVFALGSCDADDGGVDYTPHYDQGCRVAVINTDYVSTSVSVLDEDGTVCLAGVITSGSKPPGVTTALSGDVVLPTEPAPGGELVLIDRYPAAVLTFVDPASGVVRRQIGVGTGYPSNPHDVLFIDADTAWVTRYDQNPTPSATAGDLDEGGDLLVVNPVTGALVDRIDLAPWASSGMEPRPDRLAHVGDAVWVTLGNLARRFDDGGSGLVVGLEPETGAFVGRAELSGLASCGGTLAVSPAGDGAWVSCTGVFQRGDAPQLSASGVAWLGTDEIGAPVEGFRMAAADIGPGRPVGHPLAALDGQRALVVVLGTLDGAPDLLYLVDRGTGAATPIGLETQAYSLNALLLAPGGRLLAADANRRRPRLRRVDLGEDGAVTGEAANVVTDPVVGLEPRALGWYR